jgi:hypothetical protein
MLKKNSAVYKILREPNFVKKKINIAAIAYPIKKVK